jgi:2,3-dihydroxybiphenyl 1,2-dioxygenase
MTHPLELGYLGVEVQDRPAFEAFLEDTVGLTRADTKHAWRNDAKAQRLIIEEGPRNDAAFLGFEATSPAAFAQTIAQLEAIGAEVTRGTADETDARAVKELASCVAPWGTRVEIVHGLANAAEPFASPLMPGGFLTDDVGFGHAVFAVPDFDAAHRFAIEGLGMTQSDWLEMDAGGFTLEVHFYHCNARHHTLALAAVPFEIPVKLHHVMLEANTADDVGAAYDRVFATQLPIANGLGKHPNDQMFSFYVVTPAGFQMEIGAGARTITEPWTDNRVYDRISSWGHQPVIRS